MADNYIEKRMADYKAGLLRQKHKPAYGIKSPVAIFFSEKISDVSKRILKLRSEGWRVAICCGFSREANTFAQRNGCRYYPFSPIEEGVKERVKADIKNRWGRIDIIEEEPINIY